MFGEWRPITGVGGEPQTHNALAAIGAVAGIAGRPELFDLWIEDDCYAGAVVQDRRYAWYGGWRECADTALGGKRSARSGRWLPLSNGTQAYPDGQRDLHHQTDDRITFGQGAA
jgi:hypothetical protein